MCSLQAIIADVSRVPLLGGRELAKEFTYLVRGPRLWLRVGGASQASNYVWRQATHGGERHIETRNGLPRCRLIDSGRR